MSQVKTLMMLQELERRRRELESAKRQAPLVKQLRELRQQVEHEQTEMRIQIGRYENLKESITRAEQLYWQLRTTLEEQRNNLYSGSVSNPRELESIQELVISLEEQVANKEEKVYTLLEEKNVFRSKLVVWQDELKATKEQYRELKNKYEQTNLQLETMQAELPVLIKDLVESIDAALMKRYQALCQEYKGQAVAILAYDTCQGCHVKLSFDTLKQVRNSDKLVNCENCGRFLVSKE